MDITETLAPTSDQLDAVDLVSGPRTFTVERVSKGNAEQPVNVHLAEFPRVWRPGKSMRRVLAAAWGADASKWAGRRVTLYCDPNVTFGKDKVGGTRISHLSHIDKQLSVPLLVTRGRSAVFTVKPLVEPVGIPDKLPDPAPEQIAALTDEEALKELWKQSSPQVRQLIEARVAELRATPTADPETGEVVEGELFEAGS